MVPPVQKIVLAATAGADQPWVADAAAQLARETGAAVAVVSVDDLETEMLAPMPRSEYREQAAAAAGGAAERVRAAGVEVTKEVRSGLALEQILAYADEQQADLIVVGSSTRSRLASRLLGTVPLSLVQSSKRPVLVVTEPSGS